MSQSLPYITSATQLPENTCTLDLRTHLEYKCKEVIRKGLLRERYRHERDAERIAHGLTMVRVDEFQNALAAKDEELTSTKAELMKKRQEVVTMEGGMKLADWHHQETLAANKICSAQLEKIESERDSTKRELAALQDVVHDLEKKAQPARLKEIALINKADRLEADLGLIKVGRNELLSDKGNLVNNLKAARSDTKALVMDTTQIQITSGAKSTEAQTLKQKLNESEESCDLLAKQVKSLIQAMLQAKKDKDGALSNAEKVKDNAAAHQRSVNTMLKGLELDTKGDTVRLGQLKEQIKTVVGENVASVMERDKEVARLGAEIQDLLLENAELREEVRLYKEDGGVMALD